MESGRLKSNAHPVNGSLFWKGVSRMYGLRGPCLNCPKRRMGCHSVCKDYKRFRALCDRAGEVARNERARDRITLGTFFKERTGWR